MADYFSISDIRFFNSYNENTQVLEYAKQNFNFDLYINENSLEGKTKLEVFDHFLVKNDTAFHLEPDVLNMGDKIPSYLKPTKVKDELKKYFTPMTNVIINHNNAYSQCIHSGYMNVQDPPTYISVSQGVREQFDTVFYKDDQIRRLQDFYYSEPEGLYTKYNFNFEKYSNDFHVYGNHLVVFNDFIGRVIYASGTYLGVFGNGNPRGFKQYFIQSDGLLDFLNNYSVTSIFKNVAFKNEHSVDYKKYAVDSNLGDISVTDAKEHYIRWGQFKQMPINFIIKPNISKQKNMNSIGTIYASDFIGAGFLYKNKTSDDDNIYIVTCSHILGKNNLTTFKASFSINDNSRKNVSETAEFRVVGRDIFTDIMVGVYDSTLPYNETFKPDLSHFNKLTINLTSDYNIGEKVYAAGNINLLDNNSVVSGSIVDPSFTGDFLTGATYVPESTLLDLPAEVGFSGSPLFKEDDDSEVVGMILGGVMGKKYVISLSSFLLENLVTNIIARYAGFSIIYKDNPTMLTISTNRALVRRWLGVISSYYHPHVSSRKHSALNYFPETHGLVIEDFILGFDFVRELFIFDTDTLTRENVTKLDGPLLKSKMYKRFTDTGKTPIVLKSATFTQGYIGQFAKYEFGKFGNQDAYYNFTYGWTAVGSKPVPEGKADNGLVAIMGRIYFEYYYYNGKEWILETEELNDDYEEEWYTVYTDALGNKFYESKWSFPTILYTYESTYVGKIDNVYGIGSGINMPLSSSIITGFGGVSAFPGGGGSYGFPGGGGSYGFPGGGGSYGFAGGGGSYGFAGGGGSYGFGGASAFPGGGGSYGFGGASAFPGGGGSYGFGGK